MNHRDALDLSDPDIREMAESNHHPAAQWTTTGRLLSVFCDACSQTWPCATIEALRDEPRGRAELRRLDFLTTRGDSPDSPTVHGP